MEAVNERTCECRATSIGRPETGEVRCEQCGLPLRPCPVCGRPPMLPQSEKTAIRVVLKEIGFAGEMMDPGGRVLSFKDGRRLRLSDQCDSCDFEKIRQFADGADRRYVLAWGKQFLGGRPDQLFVNDIDKAVVFDEGSARDVARVRPELLELIEVEVREEVVRRRIVRPRAT